MNESNIDFIFFTGDNGIDFPKGGITSFTRQMMHVFGNRMALVGISTDITPVGKWVHKEFDGKTYLFLAIAPLNKNKIKPLVPKRLSSYFQLRKYKKKILEIDVSFQPGLIIQYFILLIRKKRLRHYVSTKNGSIPSMIIYEQTGYLHTDNTPKEIAGYLKKLTDKNRLMLMGRSARQRFLSNYEISVFSNNFQRIINKCI